VSQSGQCEPSQPVTNHCIRPRCAGGAEKGFLVLSVHPVGVVLLPLDLEPELEWLRSRGVRPEEYDTDQLKTVNGIAEQRK